MVQVEAIRSEAAQEVAPVVSVVMPCLNEVQTVGRCVAKARGWLERRGVAGEIIVSDNGSTDGSQEAARVAGARVVNAPKRGYGNAYHAGLAAARGQYVIIGDSDDTYDFGDLDPFVAAADAGADIVIGNRLKGQLEAGAMPFLHRYIGTPLFALLLKLFFGVYISDSQSGMRLLTRHALTKLSLKTPGMEFVTEMTACAALLGLRVTEVPINYGVRRGSESKLDTVRDGWRHLRFLLFYSPAWVFVLPGLLLLLIGVGIVAAPLLGINFEVGGVAWRPVYAGSILGIAGFQILSLGLLAKVYAYNHGLPLRDKVVRWLSSPGSVEKVIGGGVLLLLAGVALELDIFLHWIGHRLNEGSVNEQALAQVLFLVGIQTLAFGFFLGVIAIWRDRR